jgi:hypothetical protein
MIETEPQNAWTPAHGRWFREAVDRYGTMCFWHLRPRRTESSLRVLVDRLRTYGDMAAWRLAVNIEAFLDERERDGSDAV